MTYGEFGEELSNVASGLRNMGFAPKTPIGIYASNCREWLVAEHACHAQNMTTVPLYDTLGPDVLEFIGRQADLAAIVCTADKLAAAVHASSLCPSVRAVIQMEPWSAGQRRPTSVPPGVEVVTLAELAASGKRNPVAHTAPLPGDIFTICYTSGTTGDPKGAVLTYANVVANSAALRLAVPQVCKDDVHISYLPLPHMFERTIQVLIYSVGASIGFYGGEVLELFGDIELLRPTIFVSVPRLFNRLYDKINAAIQEGGPIKTFLFNRAFAAKQAALKDGHLTHALWDRLVFNKIKAKLGGRVHLMITGSAPISGSVLDFLRVCFSCQVLEGYGQTEASAAVTVTAMQTFSSGHVGAPVPSCEVKLVDVPEMNYTSQDTPCPRGEVCVRGPSVFSGYFKLPEQTAEALDADGWLHSGDIGMWTEEGFLKIIDRKKNIFKLAQGEYVAPEKIENVYQRSPFVLQSFVHGDSLQPSLVGIVVPDPDVLQAWAKTNLPELANDLRALCAHEKTINAVHEDMVAHGKDAKLRAFEQVRRIHLAAEPFSVEQGILTPTFKLKRPQARALFAQVINDMYA